MLDYLFFMQILQKYVLKIQYFIFIKNVILVTNKYAVIQ